MSREAQPRSRSARKDESPGTGATLQRFSGGVNLAFLPGVAERLGYYVYLLRDPQTAEIFYVGKGRGGRVYQHAAQARKVPGETGQELKLDKIRRLHADGLEPRIEILRHGLTEEEAFEVEAAVIDLLQLTGTNLGDLTNRARGMWSRAQGWAPLDELRARYAAPPVEISHRAVLIRINRAFRVGMSDRDLYEATRKWWVINPKRRPDYAFAVYNGIVRAVYRIDPKGWTRHENGRWRFRGSRDETLERAYCWRNVATYLPNGAQNPIRYVGC